MKHLLLFFLLGLSITMNAQDGFKFGGGLSYAGKAKNVGIQLKALKGITEKVNGELSGTYFFESGATVTSVDANVQYKLLEINDTVTINPLTGLNFGYVKSGDDKNTAIGINVGFEVAFPVSGMNFYLQPKYVIDGLKGSVVSAGIFF